MAEVKLNVKSFVLNNKSELLIIQRSLQDPIRPGIWEFPGGHLDPGQDPFVGLRTKTMEEAGIDIQVEHPLWVHSLTTEEGDFMTMISFLCRAKTQSVVLDPKHINFLWVDLESALKRLHPTYHEDVQAFKRILARH